MSDNPLDRRAFFSFGFRKVLGKAAEVVEKKYSASEFVRPPGALPEIAFLAACTRCGECETACPVSAIRALGTDQGLRAGTPIIEVNVTACVMCTDMPCAKVCPTDALTVPEDLWASVHLSRIAIDADRCIAFRDVECGVCARVCPAGESALRIDDRGRPVLGAACTGCGTCINACVTAPSSISTRPYGS
jgi:ferredoxin-type protein NapG